MMNRSAARTPAPMSHDAYAGFLKLWLTPTNELPSLTAEVDAYLRHVSARERQAQPARRAPRQTTRKAA
jgi:hypothetical protein